MSNVKRVYVEKKSGFDVQAKELKTEIRSYLGIKDVDSVRVLIRYDVENVSDETFEFGMKGFKSVRNYLRDKKFSRFEKERQWVVCDGDRIVWLVNERVDNRFRVMPETRLVIKMKVKFV